MMILQDKLWFKNTMSVLGLLALISTVGLFVIGLFPEATAAGIITWIASNN